MEKHISESMNNEILKKAASLFDTKISQINYHGGFENFIYMFTKNSSEYVLRFVHSDHRIFNHVLGEIEFIDYLEKHGACVSTVIESINHNIVEKIMINDKDYFSVSVFTKGLGGRDREYIRSEDFWINLGEQIGLLHKLTKDFNPKHKRGIWYDETLYKIADKVLIDDQLPILKILRETINNIKTFKKTKDNFGLIHTDLHIGNMVMDENKKLTFFDFDDASYKHFISDIAIVIFYQLFYQYPPIKERNDRTIWMLKNFFEGYNKHNYLPKEELLHLNDFLKLRELTLYTVILAGGPDVYNSDWGSHYIKLYRDKIIEKTPFIDVEYVISNLNYV